MRQGLTPDHAAPFNQSYRLPRNPSYGLNLCTLAKAAIMEL
jgi:hypothetical protein